MHINSKYNKAFFANPAFEIIFGATKKWKLFWLFSLIICPSLIFVIAYLIYFGGLQNIFGLRLPEEIIWQLSNIFIYLLPGLAIVSFVGGILYFLKLKDTVPKNKGKIKGDRALEESIAIIGPVGFSILIIISLLITFSVFCLIIYWFTGSFEIGLRIIIFGLLIGSPVFIYNFWKIFNIGKKSIK